MLIMNNFTMMLIMPYPLDHAPSTCFTPTLIIIYIPIIHINYIMNLIFHVLGLDSWHNYLRILLTPRKFAGFSKFNPPYLYKTLIMESVNKGK